MATPAAPVKAPDTVTPPGLPKEVPQVTDAYRKAHKSYVLVSGLLASWELIGITLNTKEKWGIELQSPTAVPLILFTLVLYSGYKMTVEWLQCDPERRGNGAARTDFGVAHGIAVFAVAISVVQYLARIRIADVLLRRGLVTNVLFTTLVFLQAVFTFSAFRFWRRGLGVSRYVWLVSLEGRCRALCG